MTAKSMKTQKSKREQGWLKDTRMRETSFKSSRKSSEVTKSMVVSIVWLAYQQVTRFRELQRETFGRMITDFGVKRSIISLKIVIVTLINQYPKILIEEICKENASEFQ